MSVEWERSEYDYLRGKRPTEVQLLHLRDNLFYDGPEVTDAYEASQLIDILQADPIVRMRREYERRLKEGPEWLAWEKWMWQSRKEYDRDQWRRWWKETRRCGHEAGVVPAQTPPMPTGWEGGIHSTTAELLNEIREVLGLSPGAEIRLEMSVGSVDEAREVRKKIAGMRECLLMIEEDAAWLLTRIRGAVYDDSLIAELFEANAGGNWIKEQLRQKEFQTMKKSLVNNYSFVSGLVKSLRKQMRGFLKRVNEVYEK